MKRAPRKRGTDAELSVASHSRDAKLSPVKKLVFSLLTVGAFFGLLEAVLAGLGFEPPLRDADPYVGFASNIPLFVEEAGADGRAWMVTAPNKRRWFNEQRFPKTKAAGTYRIFSLGGSTTYGRPYDDRGSFSGWLREFLPAADPSRNWEVINAGGVSYASYRLAVVMEELTRYEPDLFVIYTGHNEFLERRTYPTLIETPPALTKAAGLLSRTRIWAAAQRIAGTPPAGKHVGGRPVLPSEVDTVLAHSVGPSEYTRDDEWRRQVVEHFRFNLNRMVGSAQSAGARVLLVVPASNLKDCSPFKSEHAAGLSAVGLSAAGLSADEPGRFETLYRKGIDAMNSGGTEAALAALEEAAAIDNRYAELHYQRGLALQELERWDDAKAAFQRAIDEDICPLRAPSEIKRVAAEVATEQGVPLIDFAQWTESRAPNGIPGADLFLDHVHPTLEGHRHLALQLIETMQRDGILEPSVKWNADAIEAAARRVGARVDSTAHGQSLRNLARVFSWTGQLDEARRLAVQALEALGEDSETYSVLGQIESVSGAPAEAERHFLRALELAPGNVDARTLLGIELVSQGRPEEAVPHLRQVLQADPNGADAHANLGLALASLGKPEQAIEHYEQALRLHPAHTEAHVNLGVELFARGRLDEAIEHFREALRLKPDYADAHANLGLALASQGLADEAIDHYGRALQLDPDHAEAHYNLANALFSQGKTAEAIHHFREALRIKPDSAQAHYNLGVALLSANGLPVDGLSADNAEKALDHLRRAVAIEPQLVETHPELRELLKPPRQRGRPSGLRPC